MSNIKISQLSELTEPNSNTNFVCINYGETKRIQLSNIRTEIELNDYNDLVINNDWGPVIQSIIDNSSGEITINLGYGSKTIKTGITLNNNYIHIKGSGPYSSEFVFEPTSNTSVITVSKGASVSYGCSLTNFSIITSDTTYNKKAIVVSDISGFLLENVEVINFFGSDSVALETYGRETSLFKKLKLYGDVPIRIRANPNTSGGWLSADHFHFTDLYLYTRPTNAPATLPWCHIYCDDGINISNLVFDGHQAWVRGIHGFYWDNTSSPAGVSYCLRFDNIRKEGALTATGYAIKINNTSVTKIQNVLINNMYIATTQKAFYFRGCGVVQINSTGKSGSDEIIDVDTCDSLEFSGYYFASTISSNFNNMRLIESIPNIAGTTIPQTGKWVYNTTATLYQSKPSRFMETCEWSWAGSLADSATFQTPINNTQTVQVALLEVAAANTANNILEGGLFALGPINNGNKGVKLISGTANTSDTNLAGKLIIFANGTNPLDAPVYVYNRLGKTVDVVLKCSYKRSANT